MSDMRPGDGALWKDPLVIFNESDVRSGKPTASASALGTAPASATGARAARTRAARRILQNLETGLYGCYNAAVGETRTHSMYILVHWKRTAGDIDVFEECGIGMLEQWLQAVIPKSTQITTLIQISNN